MFKTNCSARYTASGVIRCVPSRSPFRLLAAAVLVAALLATLAPSPSALAATPSGLRSAPAVIDYSSGFDSSTPAKLKKAGVGVVIRYVGSSAWKCLTRAEARALRKHGIDIAAVYESDAAWMLGGRQAGVSAAKAARTAIIADGGPKQPFVYFACDTDTSDFASVNAALRGAQSVLGAQNVGIYGSYSVCESALRTGAAAKAWQTVAWSGGRVLHGAALLQLVPQTLGNLGVDYDSNVRYLGDIGQWGAAGPQGALFASGTIPGEQLVKFTLQSTSTSATLRAIESTDGVNAWAVGDGGIILHTASAGTTWTAQSTPTSATLNAVQFLTGSDGWAAGEGGTIFHTADAGVVWDGESTPTTATLTSIYFADAENGWAVGEHGIVLHTDNGGVNWTRQSVPTTGSIEAVQFSSDTTGVAVGANGTFLYTGNGGRSWFAESTPTTATLSAYVAMSPTAAWSIGASGTALVTGNDGATWVPQSLQTTATLDDIEFAGGSRGVAVGASSTALFTADGGRTWARQSVPTTGTLKAVELTGTRGWVVGEGGTVLRLQVVNSR